MARLTGEFVFIVFWAALVSTALGCEGGGTGGPGVDPPMGGTAHPEPGFPGTVRNITSDGGANERPDAGEDDGGDGGQGGVRDAGGRVDTGTAGDAGESDRDAGSRDDLIVLDGPIFFDLPINSLRYAVSGWDENTGLCVTAVWFLSTMDDMVEHCDDFGDLFPYLVIEPALEPGCWDYGDNAVVHSAQGCVDWAAFGPGHQDRVELELEVTSTYWSGTVRFDNTP